MIRIAIDAMGGDYAPKVPVETVNQAVLEYKDVTFVLFGDEDKIKEHLTATDRVEIVHTTEVITGDDEPVRSIRRKKDSSLVRAFRAVKEGQADVLVSSGNTGALLAGGLMILGRVKNVDRAGLMPIMPSVSKDKPRYLLMDAGANVECKPENLFQFAHLADVYARRVLGIDKPTIGLLNNGTEEGKGSDVTKEAYQLLKEDESLNFIGNVEATDILYGGFDILIADGIMGNTALKALEGTSSAILTALKEEITEAGIIPKIGAALLKGTLKKLLNRLNPPEVGGAVLLGVKKGVIKAHGSAKQDQYFAAIGQARNLVKSGAVEEITEYFEKIEIE